MLRALPYFRALLRAVEADFYQEFDLASPILDVGSGDGHFASVTFKNKLDMGVDPSAASLREAKNWGAYKHLVQAQGANMPFPAGHFGSAVSNSVLEHIADLQPVLVEIARLLPANALFLFSVPNHRWPKHLALSAMLKKLGLKRLGSAYSRMFQHISRHVYMLSPREWREHLGDAGFRLEDYWHYFPPSALHVLEWGHYFGLPSLLTQWLFGRWVLMPTRWNLAITKSFLRKYAVAQANAEGTYTFFVARRK